MPNAEKRRCDRDDEVHNKKLKLKLIRDFDHADLHRRYSLPTAEEAQHVQYFLTDGDVNMKTIESPAEDAFTLNGNELTVHYSHLEGAARDVPILKNFPKSIKYMGNPQSNPETEQVQYFYETIMPLIIRLWLCAKEAVKGGWEEGSACDDDNIIRAFIEYIYQSDVQKKQSKEDGRKEAHVMMIT